MPLSPYFLCSFCARSFPTRASVGQHVANNKSCRERRDTELAALSREHSYHAFGASPGNSATQRQYTPTTDVQCELLLTDINEPHTARAQDLDADPDAQPPAPISHVSTDETVLHDSAPRYAQPSPPHLAAGASFGTGRTGFEKIRDKQIWRGEKVWGSFDSEEDWELAKWLVTNVGHAQAESFLKLGIVSARAGPAYTNKSKLYQAVDALPSGPGWKCQELVQTGDLVDAEGRPLTESLELWFRDPIDCVRELLGNPMFKNLLAYAPERVYRDSQGRVRHIDETWTANWWWEVQDARRSPSMHGTILIGYIPVGEFDCFSEQKRSLARYQAFHAAMKVILDSMVHAGKEGIFATCADQQVRRVHPILAAYVADYPEQCLVVGCMENCCPIGQIAPQNRGSHQFCAARDQKEILDLLSSHRNGTLTSELRQRFDNLGLRAIHDPFWRDLPYADVFRAFTPDLLHQLHKGVFKDHLVKWCTELISEIELDKRYMSLPTLHGLRHFKSGISGVSQWTGHEHKEMEKMFLALIAGGVDDEVVLAVRALLDFVYFSSFQSHTTTTTLAALKASLDNFHSYKDIFIHLGARNPPHFNIPKYHMLEHYVQLILDFGSADGFNTEWSERLHIDYAKDAYRASNKHDYTVQMTRWLSRQEAVDRFTVYLDWCKRGEYSPLSATYMTTISELPLDDDEPNSTESHHKQATTQPYKVAAASPRHLQGISVADISSRLGVSQFLPALRVYLQSRNCLVNIYERDGFDLYKELVVHLPPVSEVSRTKLKNVVRASPAMAASGRRQAEPAQCDFALLVFIPLIVSGADVRSGLRIAHVRAIFNVPKHFNVGNAHPLVYLEWFTPFHTPDTVTGLHIITRSTRRHLPYGEIVEADRIVRNCYLQPKCGRVQDVGWTSEAVKDKCRVFYVNSYIDYHMFLLLRLGDVNAINSQ
ncbi:hypothetical protein BC835DRAFT_1280656 [Cytidiella melzeri]|nr:hypothetical protein BC835DRAFT_1280656 [Cytidiella melzeri]